MNKNTLLPLFLGLALVGCTRTSTDSPKVSANDPPAAAKPTVTDDKAPAATPDSASQPQFASTPTPAPSTDKDKDIASDSMKLTPDPLPAVAVSPPTDSPMPTPPPFDATGPAFSPTPNTLAATDTPRTGGDATSTVSQRITEWKLTGEEIKSEFESSGRVVRSKTPGVGEPTGAMGTALVRQINSKLQDDTDTAKLNIDVKAAKGVVTLNGSAESLDQIGKAIALSLDTGGVTQTISLIKLKVAPDHAPGF